MPTLERKTELNLGDDVVILLRFFDRQAQSRDCILKDIEVSDYAPDQVWGKKRADFYLLDRYHGCMGTVETMKAIKIMCNKWPKARGIYVEDKVNGTAAIEMLKKEISGIVLVTPNDGKEVRANIVTPLWETGNIYLSYPLICPWANDFTDELVTFPNAEHNDSVNSTTQLSNKMVSKVSLGERYLDG